MWNKELYNKISAPTEDLYAFTDCGYLITNWQLSNVGGPSCFKASHLNSVSKQMCPQSELWSQKHNLYSVHSSSRSSTIHLPRPQLLVNKSAQLLCPVHRKTGSQEVNAFIHTSSHFHCSACIALRVLYSTLHFNRLISILHNRTIITDCLTVRYDTAFIALSRSWVFLGFSIVLSQAVYSDPSPRLTPFINSARRSAESHI